MIPKTPVPPIATDSLYSTGPEAGQPTRVALSLSLQKQGFLAGVSYPAANANALLGPLSDHVTQLSEISVRNWTRIPTVGVSPFLATGIYKGIFAAPSPTGNASQFYAFGSNNLGSVPLLARTRYGADWSSYSSFPSTSVVAALAANTSYLVAAGTMSGKAAYSTDLGATWTQVASHASNDYDDVCELNGTFYAVTTGGTTVGKSAGNVAWTATTTAPGATSLLGIRAGGTSGNAILCFDTARKTYISTNGGSVWTSSGTQVFANAILDIRYSAGAGLWMAISNKFEVATSPDGFSWTVRKTAAFGANVSARLATDGSGVWVAAYSIVDANNLPGSCVAYSLDNGTTWKNIPLTDVGGTPFICYSALQDCFWAMFRDTGNTQEPRLFRSFSTGTGAAIVG